MMKIKYGVDSVLHTGKWCCKSEAQSITRPLLTPYYFCVKMKTEPFLNNQLHNKTVLSSWLYFLGQGSIWAIRTCKLYITDSSAHAQSRGSHITRAPNEGQGVWSLYWWNLCVAVQLLLHFRLIGMSEHLYNRALSCRWSGLSGPCDWQNPSKYPLVK